MRIQELLYQNNQDIAEGDYLDIELDDIVIETSVVGFMHDGVILEADDVALAYLKTEELNEDWKQNAASLALAGAAALGAGGANAGGVTLGGGGHTAQDQVSMNQQMTQQAAKRDLSSFPSSYLEKAADPQGGRYIVTPADAKAELSARQAGTSQYKPAANDKPMSSGYSKEYLEKVIRGEHPRPLIDKETAQRLLSQMNEAEYQGRKVPLGKPMAGDVKKSKVYVKGPSGRVVKVNFGDKKMKIKKSNPARRKSFRARHNCANPGPRHKARFWSCRAWE